MFSLIPKEEKFFEMFKESAQNIHRGAALLCTFFTLLT
jgi:hypothetical protein